MCDFRCNQREETVEKVFCWKLADTGMTGRTGYAVKRKRVGAWNEAYATPRKENFFGFYCYLRKEDAIKNRFFGEEVWKVEIKGGCVFGENLRSRDERCHFLYPPFPSPYVEPGVRAEYVKFVERVVK